MWGEYETSEGKVGAVSINYDLSKAKRDDKTYNNETLDEVHKLLKKLIQIKIHFSIFLIVHFLLKET